MTDLPSGWQCRALGELVEVLDHARVPVSAKARAERAGPVPYFGAAGQVGWIDQALFDEPLVLLGEDGVQFFDKDKAKAYAVDGPTWVNNHAHVLRPRVEAVDRRFLLHALNTIDYRGFANGTTRLKLTQAAMRRLPIPLPALSEQRRIVAILEDHLSRLDAADAYLQSAQLKAQSWSDAEIDRVVWSRVDDNTVALSDLLGEPMRNGVSSRAAAPGEAGIRTLTLTAVTRKTFSDQFSKVTVTTPWKATGLWLRAGDILVQRSNTAELVGTAALYDGPPDWAIFPDLLIRVRVDESRVTSRYVAAVLSSRRAHEGLRRKAKGLAGSMPKIDQGALGAVAVPLADLVTQHEVVQKVDHVAGQHERLLSEVRSARRRVLSLRRGILEAAFSGQLTGRSNDPDIAEELVKASANV